MAAQRVGDQKRDEVQPLGGPYAVQLRAKRVKLPVEDVEVGLLKLRERELVAAFRVRLAVGIHGLRRREGRQRGADGHHAVHQLLRRRAGEALQPGGDRAVRFRGGGGEEEERVGDKPRE